jgi:HK97 family phage portal protein
MIKLNLSPPERRSTALTPSPNILESPAVPLSSPAAWAFWNGWGESSSGELVNDITMMHSATINACVSLLSNSIASMSPILYQRVGAGRSEAFNHPLHSILTLEPNAESTAFSLWFRFMTNILLTGAGYIEIQRDAQGNPVALWGLDSRQVTIIRQADGSLAFRSSEAMATGETRTIQSADCIYVPWHLHPRDGVTGISGITLARSQAGLDLAMDRYAGNFYANSAVPSGILTAPPEKTIKPEVKQLMRQDWEQQNGGSNRRRTAVLDQGMTFTPLSISQADADYIASKNMSRQALCGLFGLLPSQIGDTARVAGETFAAQQLTFLVDCLRPWLNRIQQELHRKLIPKYSGLTIEHDISDRLRVDFASQMQGYATGRQWGWYSANDIRAKLGENPIGAEGNVYLQASNMFDASKPAPAPQPTKPTDTGAPNV